MATNTSTTDVLRKQFLTRFSIKHGGEKQVIYLGQLNPDDIPEDGLTQMQKNINGKERLIEYHLFETVHTQLPILCQWRLNQ